MPLANIDPMKRISAVLFQLESTFLEARAAAAAGDKDKMYRRIGTALEMVKPLLDSLTILEESERKSLVEKLLGMLN